MTRAIWVNKNDDGQAAELRDGDAPGGQDGDEAPVEIDVEWSTLNYKDALAVTGRGKVLRTFPMVPGIDLAGTVRTSASSDYAPGDRVLVTGYGLGEARNGGLAESAVVPAAFVVPVPEALSTRQAMALGTAGFTAMLCVEALAHHGVGPDAGEIVVTGAAGGVGSIAVAALAQRGYHVVASTGRPEQEPYLRSLGASDLIERSVLAAPARPLDKERWAGAVDTVGSQTLASICATTRYYGVVTACGLAGGMDFPATVAPFILRGVTLQGVESVQTPTGPRRAAWDALARDIDADLLESMTEEIALGDAIAACDRLLAGQVRGRLVVDTRR
ncbi:MAG: MDR family oxidoreductase [Desertimonas sp.]